MRAAKITLMSLAGAVLCGCSAQVSAPAPEREPDRHTMLREQMVVEQIARRGIKDPRVLEAMRAVPRHEFVPASFAASAYEDQPLPIGAGQTISQPYVVAFMTEQLDPRPEDRVLEIGTGSGYQAAILSKLVAEIYTIEIIESLAAEASARLDRLGCTNVHVRAGDGYLGWPDAAPFDAVIVTCAPDQIPRPLIEQLADGGRMIIPVGSDSSQELYLLQKHGDRVERRAILPVRFVPMTGRAEAQ